MNKIVNILKIVSAYPYKASDFQKMECENNHEKEPMMHWVNGPGPCLPGPGRYNHVHHVLAIHGLIFFLNSPFVSSYGVNHCTEKNMGQTSLKKRQRRYF